MSLKPRDTNSSTSRVGLLACFLLLASAVWGAGKPQSQVGADSSEKTLASEKDGGTPTRLSSNPPGKPRQDDYVIGPEDVLAINVWRDTEVSRTMPVRPDGRISLPLIGELQASGLTAAKLQEVITQRLKDYIANPQVNVIVQEIKSRSFNIVGKVLKPGSYDLAKPMTVLDAVALAGGFQDFAKANKMYVLRRMADGSQAMLHFNYKLVIKGKALDQNVQLQPGDTVVAP